MGQVFRARGPANGGVVALKVIRPALLDEPHRRRFAHEARALLKIRHPHLPDVSDIGEVDERQYIAMRYIDGPTLADRLRASPPLTIPEIVRIIAEVAAGLDALRRAGIVHRDVKPANILLDSERGAVLTDLGLAKHRDFSSITAPGSVLGTLHYLAPETIRGEEPRFPGDVYALGCVTYECLAGRPPFIGSRLAVGMGHLEDEPDDPCARRTDAPPLLGTVVRGALEKDPDARPPTATAFARMLIVATGRG
jgi:serine/threonine-protein kinase